jgi:hypothetical protein
MSILVVVHSIWRWVVLATALAALVKAFIGWQQQQPYTPLDRRFGMMYTMAVDIQVLIGLILWITEQRFLVFAGSMANAQMRFYGVEHPAIMLAALALAHIGYSRSRRGVTGEPELRTAPQVGGGARVLVGSQHRTAALFYLASFILILAAIPWDRLGR